VDADGPEVSLSVIEATLCSIQESSEFSYENMPGAGKKLMLQPRPHHFSRQ
jgi:hypothetical protein